MNPTVLLGIVVLVAGLTGCVGVLIHLGLVRHRDRVALEKITGNLKLRRTMSMRVGRRMNAERLTYVGHAETMRGWVWVMVTKRNGVPLAEQVGWAPTRRLAHRSLERHVRPERGSGDMFSLVMLILGILLFAAVAPHIADKLLGVDFAGWLRHVNHELWTWLRGL